MRSLVQPAVIRSAGVASLLTTLACTSRLFGWPTRGYSFWLLWLTLLWAAFILWSFVFAWHTRFTGRKAFLLVRQPTLWITATLCGVAGASILHLFIDPVLRSVAPLDYPDTLRSWAAMTLFLLAFDQLFLCFAPFAFFVRLFRNEKIAAALTVLFGMFLVSMKLRGLHAQFTAPFLVELFTWRILAGSLSVFFYLKGGTLLNWWWIALLQVRHLGDVLP